MWLNWLAHGLAGEVKGSNPDFFFTLFDIFLASFYEKLEFSPKFIELWGSKFESLCT